MGPLSSEADEEEGGRFEALRPRAGENPEVDTVMVARVK